jgi:hypothetical protein
MNDEMKTLKNLPTFDYEHNDPEIDSSGMVECSGGEYVEVELLRQEAIKWIKELYNNPKYKPNDCYGDSRESIYWIKHFFNLSEEDLK